MVLPEAVRHRFLSREEYFSGMIFEKWPTECKRQGPTQEETDAAPIKRIEMLQRAKERVGRPEPPCPTCGQRVPLTDAEWEVLDAEWAARGYGPPPAGETGGAAA